MRGCQRGSEVLPLCAFMQLMVASTVDGSYVFCGEVGGSVVNALHFGRDPRGKEPSSHIATAVMLATYLTVQPCLRGLRTPSLKVVWDCLQGWVLVCPVTD